MLALFVTQLVQPVISSVVKGKSGRGVRRAGRRYIYIYIYIYIYTHTHTHTYIWKFFVPLLPLSSTEITNYVKYEPRFNCVFSRNNLPKIKDGAYVTNLDDKDVKEHIGFHYILTKI